MPNDNLPRVMSRPVPLCAALLVLATLVAYLPVMWAGYVWDDDGHVTNNLPLRSLAGLGRIWLEPGAVQQYYPLVHTSFWLEYRLWGLRPLGYHLVNVLLHGLNAVLVWRILLRLGLPGALLAGAVFALHPVHAESVAWISERKNVLAGFFYLAAMQAYLHFRPLAPAAAHHAAVRRWPWLALSLGAFLCALLSKTVTCTLPGALLLLIWWKSGRIRLRDLSPLWPMLVLGAALGSVTIWVEKQFIGAQGAAWSLSWLERTLIAGRALSFYLGKLLWPGQLIFIYPRWRIDSTDVRQYVYPAAALLALAALWAARRRIGRGPLVATLFFAGTLVPALGFFDVYPFLYSFVADHFQYLPSLGPIALASTVATIHLARIRWPARHVAKVMAVAVLTVLGLLTFRQSRIYHDAEVLWRDTVAKNPSAAMAHNNLGNLLADRGELSAALPYYAKAIELEDDADYTTNLANALARLGRLDAALEQYRRATERNPQSAYAHFNWGTVLLEHGRLEQAAAHLAEAVRINPQAALAHYNLAIALGQQDRMDEAARHYVQALEIHPDYAEAHHRLADILRTRGDCANAVEHYTIAARLKPGTALSHYYLGVCLLELGRAEEAIGPLSQAVALAPAFAEGRAKLGDALHAAGRTGE